jgi:hypothetical protein
MDFCFNCWKYGIFNALKRDDACPPICLISSYWWVCFDLIYMEVILNSLFISNVSWYQTLVHDFPVV